jgi:hypothetical protein
VSNPGGRKLKMTPEMMRKLIGILALVAWLPFVLSLYPLPQQTASTVEDQIRQTQKDLGPLAERINPKPIEEQIAEAKVAGWGMWVVNLALVITGVVASALAFKNMGVWRGLLLTLSLLFLAIFIFDLFILPYGSFAEVLSWKWTMIQKFVERGLVSSYVFFTLKEFVLPIVHVVILGLVLYCWSKVEKPLTA